MKQEKKKGLGRGVNDLFGGALQEETGTPSTLSISQVQPWSKQPRKHFDPEAISDLAESIRLHGIIQPLAVRLLDSGFYEIVAGERRWRAAKEANLVEVPVIIIEADDRKVMELGLIENLQREDLNPVEEAKGYQLLMTEYQLTQEDVSARMGKSRSAIANALRLLNLPETLLNHVMTGALSSGHARTLLSCPNTRMMEEVADRIMKEDWSVRRTEETIKAMKRALELVDVTIPEPRKDDIYLYVRDSEDTLTRQMGRKVQIQHKGKKGKIVLDYSDEHDLTDLVEVLSSLQEGNHGDT